MESAYEWGAKRRSCEDALEARKALGPDATQADWYRVCERGDWLLWQLERLPRQQRAAIQPIINGLVEAIIARAIRRGQRSLRGIGATWATQWRRWARRWLSGTDRTKESAWAAAEVAAEAAAWAAARAAAWAAAWVAAEVAGDAARVAEMRRQAREIHAAIPAWPGGEG